MQNKARSTMRSARTRRRGKTRRQSDGLIRRASLVVLCSSLVWLLFAGPLPLWAQDAAPAQEIRQSAEQILSEPEFRYFEHLDDSPVRPEQRGKRAPQGFGSGQGGSNEAGGAGSSQNGNRSQGQSTSSRNNSGPNRSDSSSSDSRSSSESASSSGSFRSGMGAFGNAVGAIFHGLAYLVLIAVCGLIIYLVVQAILNRESRPEAITTPQLNLDIPAEEDHPPGELPADAYLAKAQELAQQGRYREAIAQLLLGGMSSIERAELIRHRRGLTLRDYLRSLRGRTPHFDGFKTMIQLYEPIGFGRRVASYQTFQEALVGYEQTVTAMA